MNQADPKEQPSVQTQQQFVAIPPNAFYPQQQDGIQIIALLKMVWQRKLFIFLISSLFSVLSIVFALSQPNVYKASAILVPASQGNNSGGLANIAGQFGGLATLAGINVGGGQTNKTQIALHVLKSRSFLLRFVEKHNLAMPLFAVLGWDEASNNLIIDPDLYDLNNKSWVQNQESGKTLRPTEWELYQRFSQLIVVNHDQVSGIITIELEYFDPNRAKKWLGLLIEDINEFIRSKEQKEAQQSIEYLTTKLEETNVANMENVFYQLIEEQTKNIMLTMVKSEFVFQTIDPPQVPDHRSKPKRALIVIIGTLLGGVVSLILILIYCCTQGIVKNKGRK